MKETELKGKLKEIIKKISQEFKDVRGDIIDKSIQIEMLLDAILINYFILPERHSEFLTEVLQTPFLNFGAKIFIFLGLKLHKKEKYKNNFDELGKKLLRLNKIRDDFAHGRRYLSEIPKIVIYRTGEGQKEKEVREIHEEFNKLYDECFNALDIILIDLIENKKNTVSN